jgi:hypothetical protein
MLLLQAPSPNDKSHPPQTTTPKKTAVELAARVPAEPTPGRAEGGGELAAAG